MSYVAFQYSEALFSLALEEKSLDTVLEDFIAITDSLDKEIYTFLNHPKITKANKKEIVKNAVSNSLLRNFINVFPFSNN